MPLDKDGILPLGFNDDPADTLDPFKNPDHDMTAPMDPFGIDKGAQGSVYIQGLGSFSGADIKIVVHVYDGGKANQNRIQLLSEDILKDLNRIDDLFGKLGEDPTAADFIAVLQKNIDTNTDEVQRLQALAPEISTKVLAEIQTLSVSTHREKFPVRALGTVYPKSFTRGPRTIAGTMIFTVFDKNVLEEFLEAHPSDFDSNNFATTALIDQLPPFDITAVFANELGQVSRMSIYGCEFVNEGQTMSIEDLLLENVVQYVARDIDPMRAISERKIDDNNRLTSDMITSKASDLLKDPRYSKYKEDIDPYTRFKNRNNIFK